MKFIHILAITFSVIASICIANSQADLASDFREFVALVPRDRIGYIAARHFIVDNQFRIALKYLRSSRFSQTWRRIRNTREFLDLVGYLQTHGVSVEALKDVTGVIDKLPNQLREFRIPSQVPVTMMMQRNLESFMREVMQALPRARFSGLMARKVREGGDFARLYHVVQQQEFRQLVARVQGSPNLAVFWTELKRNYIDVNSLVEMVYEIISWGP
ncbi:protein G12-like [Haematobia irritans]|uniref:protein G12-like n=1 Tax=Haematobia irritans TaxID=7368 RepID=UPI003F50096C